MVRYEKYKDSGVEWIGEIPEGWEVKPLTKYLESIADYRGRTPKKIDSGMFLVTAKNIKKGRIDYSLSEEYVAAEDAQILLNRGAPEVGDVLFTTEAPLGEVANIDREDIALAQRVIKFRGIKEILDNYFLKYFLMSDCFQQDLYTFATGSTALGIKASKLSKLIIVMPSLKDQTTIANYLDRKTAEIDELITQKERLIELYEEEKTAIINQAVTKGIDPDVRLKESGIDWLGEIPEHWEMNKLRYLGSCQNGVSKGGEYFGSGFPFVSYGDVYNDFVLPQQVDGLAESTENDRANYSVTAGDVLFTRTSETADEIGFTSTCLKTIDDAIFSGFLIRFRPNTNTLFEGFSKYYFSSSLHRLFFVKEMNLVTRASLSQELLKKLPVLLPPIIEQKQISTYLDKAMEHINAKIEKTEKIIELQKEYRTALISEVVTGKIKIPQETKL